MTALHSDCSQSKYRADIDGLRAVAVLSVVVFHAFPNLISGGYIGVDIFFVISGYLISSIVYENLYRGTFSFNEFYVRRINRIFPALFLVLIICFGLGWFTLLADEYKQLGKHIGAGAGFISNFILWNEASYFDNSAETKPLLHLWSLGIEEQFYLSWPFLMWICWRRKVIFFTATTLAILLSFYLNLKSIEKDSIATFYSPQTRYWELLSGCLLSLTIFYGQKLSSKTNINFNLGLNKFNKKEIYTKILSNLFSLMGILLLFYGFSQFNKDTIFPGKWAIIPVVGTMLIIASGPKSWFNHKILSNKILVWFGLISFPLYLWHWPLLSFARIIESEKINCLIRCVIVLVSIVFAWLTYRFIEYPIRHQYIKFKTTILLLLISLIGFLGLTVYIQDGLGFRNQDSYPLIKELTQITDVYNFFDYNQVLRTGECHSVTLDEIINHKCIDIRKKNILLWGDSYAASLYAGLLNVRNNYYRDYGITQITDGNGPPFFINERKKTDDGKTLLQANNNRLLIASKYKPDIIIIAWMVGGLNAPETKEQSIVELNSTIDKILSVSPETKIIIIGPFPRWTLSLRKQILEYRKKFRKLPKKYMNYGLEQQEKEWDLFYKNSINRSNVVYISAQDILCRHRGCLTRTTDSAKSLTAIDWGHLTNSGSTYLIQKIRKRIFL